MTTTNDIDYSHLCARDYTHPPFEQHMPREVRRQLTEKQKDVLADYDYAIQNIKFWQRELAKECDYLAEMYAKAAADEGYIEEQRRRFQPIGHTTPQWEWDGYQKRCVACAYNNLMKHVAYRDRAVNDFNP